MEMRKSSQKVERGWDEVDEEDPKGLIKEVMESPTEKIIDFVRKPTGFVITILICVILFLVLQFGSL